MVSSFHHHPAPRAGTPSRDREAIGGGCGATSDNMHEKYQYHRCFLAFSPRLSPQLPMPSVAVLLSLLSVQLSPIDFAPTPLQSRTHQRGKKGLVFSSEKGERENYTPPLSTVQPRTPRQAGGQGRQEASSAKALRETAEPAAALRYIGREGSPPPGEARILASLAGRSCRVLRLVALRPLAGGQPRSSAA